MQSSAQSSFRTFPSPPKFPSSLFVVSSQLHTASPALGNYWSTFCFYKFFGTLHLKGHTTCSLCIWLLSLDIMFLRFIHSIACMSILFLFIAECYFIIDLPYFVYSFTGWKTLRSFLVFYFSLNIHGHVFVWAYVFISLPSVPKNGIARTYNKLTF